MESPTAVEVKLLLSENNEWRAAALYGAHQPSATTWPCRTTITLCSEFRFLSAASTNARIADEEMPWASGALRGSSAPWAMGLPKTSEAITTRVFMRRPAEPKCSGDDQHWNPRRLDMASRRGFGLG